ncbi:PhyH-domain-containing protein [Wallemia mellicola]|nr:PhyH-domain-containing protein [Wallemia mellicola]TIC08099.1 PhyH-domain-containing protein [Wallemia mellicola]TIC23075.1 PhyH-domain-containing protein [Wallemia mellicola]TIC74910.1 PhyH-domain-containing protein [Wallemia mellicola]
MTRLFSKFNPLELGEICSTSRITKNEVPRAREIIKQVPIYHKNDISLKDADGIMEEWHNILQSGPGVFVVKNLVDDHDVVDRAHSAAEAIIEAEKIKYANRGDHFAAGGKNDRIWNYFQKHAVQDPASFADYYDNPILNLICESWLGLGYALTSQHMLIFGYQLNVVLPSRGAAQEPHRDFHLGFQSSEQTTRFPAVTQMATQLLTLQGAVAHSDMPLESGPTLLLPFSQKYESGYIHYRNPELIDYFKANAIAIPMSKGDSLFFNPGLHHAAGANVTSGSTGIKRSANLLQISSPFGKPMETVDRTTVALSVWNDLSRKYKETGFTDSLNTLVNVVGQGYSLPTNLDLDPPPPNGHCPPTQQEIIRKGLQEGWDYYRAKEELLKRDEVRRA